MGKKAQAQAVADSKAAAPSGKRNYKDDGTKGGGAPSAGKKNSKDEPQQVQKGGSKKP